MNKIKRLLSTISLTVLVIWFIGSAGLAAKEFDNKPVADEMIGSGGITWVPKVNYRQLVLTISRPDGTVLSKTIDSGSTPYAELSEIFGSSYEDGSYTYQLLVIPMVQKKARGGKDLGERTHHKAVSQSGAFLVKGGAIVTPVGFETQSAGSGSFSSVTSNQPALDSTNDQVILDDLIVDGSACIGQDCVNGESFGFDTLRLKENNLRIKFQDTSASASFPSNDWQLTANDSSNGGANKFSIDDIDGGRTPFTLEAGAPSHSLYVDDGGRLGLGTSTPVVDAHIVSGNTPTVRLEQNGSSGFTPQTWDVAGNEANFFVRDATNGSTLPFKIKPGAPNNSLFIENTTGDIGFGTTAPDADLHVVDSGAAKLTLENTAANGNLWSLNSSATGNFRINANNGATSAFAVETNGDVTITGQLTTAANTYPDYVFESDYELMPLKELSDYVRKEKHLPRVPAAAQMKKNGINMSELQMRLLEKVEELTLYTLSQQETIDALKREMAELKKK